MISRLSRRCSFCVVLGFICLTSLSSFRTVNAVEEGSVEDFATKIERRIKDWQPTPDEKLLDQVGWASDLVEAKRLAKKHDRPLFVFTYSGSSMRANAMALQRCSGGAAALRASSLSNRKVIELLNAHFVPVYVDGTYLQNNPEQEKDELAAYRELFAEMHRANKARKLAGKSQLSVGTVHAYGFTADGSALDSRHVAHAGPESVIKMLETIIKEVDAPAGKPIVKPSSQSPRPEAADDAIVLHLTARYLVPRDRAEARKDVEGELVPRDANQLGGERSGGWHALPSEDWFVLLRDQWTEFLPEKDQVAKLAVGDSWSVDSKLADTLLTRFYPTTELNDLSINRIDERSLKLTVISRENTRVVARIDGHLKMKHPFYPRREDDNFVNATLTGVIEFDAVKPLIRSLQIVTENATYGENGKRTQPFGVALKNIE